MSMKRSKTSAKAAPTRKSEPQAGRPKAKIAASQRVQVPTEFAALTVPADLRQALAGAPSAAAAWKDLTPIARRDFMCWIDSAKQSETRRRRIKRACENLAAGKRRPCCYAVVPMDLYKALGAALRAKAQWSELTPAERRDVVDWIDAAEDREARKGRIGEACAMLAVGKRRP